jgi:hypothetical protein
MTEKQMVSSRDYIKELHRFYRYTLRGVIIIVAAMIYILFTGDTGPQKTSMPHGNFLLLIFGAFVLAYLIAFLIRNRIQKDIFRTNQLSGKLRKYRHFYLSQILVWKAIMTIALIGFSLSDLYVLLAFAAIAVLSMLLQRPSSKKVIEACKLQAEEKDALENPDTVLYSVVG